MPSLYNVSFTVLDADGNNSSVVFKVPVGTLTLAQITEYAQEQATNTDACIEGQITEVRVVLDVALPGGLKGAPVALSNVQEGALFSFQAADTKYKHGIRLPSFKQAYFTGKEVDQTEPDVAGWLTGVITGLDASGTNVPACDNYGNDLTSVAKAYKSFRR